MKRWHTLFALALWLAASGCGETGPKQFALRFYGRGVASEPFDVDGFSVQLTAANVAIGPLYVCASRRSSSDLCPAAVAEFTNAASVDALDSSQQRLGTMQAITATGLSIGFDYGITWPASEAQPVALRTSIGRHSAHFEGRADGPDRSFTFSADLDVEPTLRATRAVQGVSTRVELADSLTSEIEIDPIAWWSQVDFQALSTDPGDAVELAPDSPALQALSTAMTSNATPTFSWSPLR